MILEVLPDLLAYLDVTLLVAGISIAAGSLLGGLLAWANLDGGRPLRALAAVYVYVMRCTPSIVLLFIVFYGLPKLLQGAFGIDMNGMNRAVFAVITFTLLFGAYISEVFRAAYKAVLRGQYEAAVCAGLSPVQAFAHVMLPQAAIVALPNFGNASINLLKEGSLITESMLKQPVVVEQGATVLLVSHYRGIEVRVPAVALSPGRVGQQIRVRNEVSGKVMLATVVDAGTVRIGA